MHIMQRWPKVALSVIAVALVTTSTVIAFGGTADAQADGYPAVAFLARADDPVDALAAGPIAARANGIVLLTNSTALNPDTAAALEALAPGLVVVVGGPAAISDAVVSEVQTLGFELLRIGGVDRAATAVALAAFGAQYAYPPGTAGGGAGPQGPPGPRGPSGLSGYEVVEREETLEPGFRSVGLIRCPEGKIPIDGGALGGTATTSGGAAPFSDEFSEGYGYVMKNDSTIAASYTVFVVCVDAPTS